MSTPDTPNHIVFLALFRITPGPTVNIAEPMLQPNIMILASDKRRVRCELLHQNQKAHNTQNSADASTLMAVPRGLDKQLEPRDIQALH